MDARASDVFVGRAGELGQLERALEKSRRGRGSTVLVAGEAGIGKTRLAAELAARARAAGVEVLLGRSIDLIGTELPYQPFVEALRAFGVPWLVAGGTAASQLQVFEQTRALLTDRAATSPVLLVLEDLHWADSSTLDLVVYLAHSLGDQPIVLLATLRGDEPSSAARLRRFVEGVRRAGAGVLELRRLRREELTSLLAARSGGAVPAELEQSIAARAEGNPFFAEELLTAAGGGGGELPRRLRDLLLHRVSTVDPRTARLLRLASAAGRDVGYPLLRAVAGVPEPTLRESLRRAVEHGVLAVDEAGDCFRFRHPLLREAVYSTILPGEREELHARLAGALARTAGAGAAELAPQWAAAGRPREALVASVDAAAEAQAVFGLAEALAHLERALAVWDSLPDAADLVSVDLAEICSRAAELASQTGAAPHAVDLTRRAIDLVDGDPVRQARLHDRLARYLHESGRTDAALAASQRAVDLLPTGLPAAERASALAALGRGLMLAWRFDESLAMCEQALGLAGAGDASSTDLRALVDSGRDLAYLGRGEEGLASLRRALQRAQEGGDPLDLLSGYVALTDVLMMLGRPEESARIGERGLEAVRRYGVDSALLLANTVEALLATGDWTGADTASATAARAGTGNFPYMLLMLRADLEAGRGNVDAARAHLDAALETLREDRGQGVYDVYVADLALVERRWTDADRAVGDALVGATSRHAAQLRVWFCAKGLRAAAELAALARARRDGDAVATWQGRAQELVTLARLSAEAASGVTPASAGWLCLAEAEFQRACGLARPGSWSAAALAWERLGRPPMAAYCRLREAEALVAAGASRTEAGVPLRTAYAVAVRLAARPLLREVELLARRARLDLMAPEVAARDGERGLAETLGLTPREAEVLSLVARGCTDREIAAALVISTKTVSVHISHILHTLGTPNRREAAAIAHRVAPPLRSAT